MYIAKKLLTPIILFVLLFSSSLYAAQDEEEACFLLLNNTIKTDNRFATDIDTFRNNDLTSVYMGGKRGDLSTYTNFTNNTEKNPHVSRYGDKFFPARRTNIATVIVKDTMVVSQIVGFGNQSNFNFPIPAKDGIPSFGDPWTLTGTGGFREYVLYAHHNIKGEFLSCGLFHITPLDNYKYDQIHAENYFTNIIQGKKNQSKLNNQKCMSSFEGQDVSQGDKKFYKMKTNVCALDKDLNDFIRMEILAFAYDNESEFFNEYVVFPLQVESMTTDSTSNQTLKDVRDVFEEKLRNDTCLSVLREPGEELPAACRGKYHGKRISYSFPEKNTQVAPNFFAQFLFPTTYAALDFQVTQEEIDNASGMMVYQNVPARIKEKLDTIPSKTFQQYVDFVFNPGYEDYIRYRREQGIPLSPFEETFLGCDIPYQERVDVIIDLIDKIDVNNFDISNFSYSNPKVGDCIIPYPDVTHRDQEIPDSFPQNKLTAQILNGTYDAPPLNEEILAFIDKRHQVELDFESEKSRLTQLSQEGQLSSQELDEQITQARTKFEQEILNIENEYASRGNTIQQTNEKQGTMLNKTDNTRMYIIIGCIAVLGVLLLGFAFRTKRK